MFNQSIRFSSSNRFDVVVKIFCSVPVMCLLCPLKFNIQSELPITLQSLVVLLVAIVYGWRIGLASVLIYITLGTIGVPVFAGYKSGFEKLTGATGGFFLGFVISAFACGFIAERKLFYSQIFILLNWTIGHCIILLCGIIWLSYFTSDWIVIIRPVLPGAAIKIIVGFILTYGIHLLVSQRKKMS